MTTTDIQSIKQRYKIIGTNPMLNRDIEIAVQVAPTDLSVLVTGESGVGKEHFPKIIHDYSLRKHGPYFALNCGAIPEGTINSELFGHEKGAFTDARAERKGYFEIADGGTLFLDEVGELPLQTQVLLLRVLETGEFYRMGSNTLLKSNVRIVAATNLDMRRAIQEGKFREDLFYRLNTVEIRVPALRERKEDIPLLFRKFAVDFSEHYRMPAIRLSDDATALLQNYYWNGNIRQLKNIAEQISVIETNHDISAETLQRYLPENEIENRFGVVRYGTPTESYAQDFSHERELLYKLIGEMNVMRQQLDGLLASAAQPVRPMLPSPTESASAIEDADTEVLDDTPKTRSQLELDQIQAALKRSHGNRKEAARLIGMSERTLYRKIKDYGL